METVIEMVITLVLSFLLGTVVLWFCSKTVETPNADFKTALIYNAIMTVALVFPLLAGLLAFTNESAFLGLVAFLVFIFYVILSFWLMMRMYAISFLSALWICIAMWGVRKLIEYLLGAF